MEDYNLSLTNPFVATTGALSAAAWLILFIGGCVAQFHGVIWWIIIYELLFVVGYMVVLGLGLLPSYHNMVYLFLAISIVYLTYVCQATLFDVNASSGDRAAAAGAIILIIMQFLLAFLLTSPEESWFRSFGTRSMSYGGNLSHRFVNTVRPNRQTRDTGGVMSEKELPRHYNNNNNNNDTNRVDDEEEDIGVAASPRNQFEPATALHGYQGSADDPSELSFEKGELLEILDKRGNWWQARKQDGTTGIVPSNYVSYFFYLLYMIFIHFATSFNKAKH
ncbi:Putative SHO1 osmosensor [Rhizopus microsporus]|nr:Putative SHO1 osmosensor [Rhizopus microsporus]